MAIVDLKNSSNLLKTNFDLLETAKSRHFSTAFEWSFTNFLIYLNELFLCLFRWISDAGLSSLSYNCQQLKKLRIMDAMITDLGVKVSTGGKD